MGTHFRDDLVDHRTDLLAAQLLRQVLLHDVEFELLLLQEFGPVSDLRKVDGFPLLSDFLLDDCQDVGLHNRLAIFGVLAICPAHLHHGDGGAEHANGGHPALITRAHRGLDVLSETVLDGLIVHAHSNRNPVEVNSHTSAPNSGLAHCANRSQMVQMMWSGVRIVPDQVDDREKLPDASNARVGHDPTRDAECSMALRFERGDSSRPSGHALLFFRTSTGGVDDVHVTYVVVLPVVVNPMKYLPPAFASQIAAFAGQIGGLVGAMGNLDAVPLPPIPERISRDELWRLATYRNDDVLDGGMVDGSVERLMTAAQEATQHYAESYRIALARVPIGETDAGPVELEAPDDDTLRWVFLDERGRIDELTKLTGRLRDAIDAGDALHTWELATTMRRLGSHLPEKYRVTEMVAGAVRAGTVGASLAQLYLDRCYKLCSEAYEDLGRIDREILRFESI